MQPGRTHQAEDQAGGLGRLYEPATGGLEPGPWAWGQEGPDESQGIRRRRPVAAARVSGYAGTSPLTPRRDLPGRRQPPADRGAPAPGSAVRRPGHRRAVDSVALRTARLPRLVVLQVVVGVQQQPELVAPGGSEIVVPTCAATRSGETVKTPHQCCLHGHGGKRLEPFLLVLERSTNAG